jgi:autotransporter-associated beta strand protein
MLAAIGATLAVMSRPTLATITITKNSNTNWTIGNGVLNVVYNPTSKYLTSVAVGSSGNLLDPKNSRLYPELTGTPFGSGTLSFGSQQTSNYIDFWTTTASTASATNPITYSFHYVMYNNDPNISVYEVVNHAATDPATSVVQGQFLARVDPTKFFNSYQYNVSPNNPGAQTSVIQNPYNFPTQTGRTVQDATTDLSGSGIPGDWGSNIYTKYDYSSYTQFLQATVEYGSQYSIAAISTSMDSMTGGPTKQNLQFTNNISMLEFLSAHYGDANYAYTPQQGMDDTRVFGPYDYRITTVGSETGAQLYQDAVNNMAALQTAYNSDTTLIANGYVPTTATARGSLQVNATNTAGWSSNTTNNTVVFSDPNRMFQESSHGAQYWAQLSATGSATISNVVPGTYRMTTYQLGQWGETRTDGVQVAAGAVTTPAGAKFIPENFSAAGVAPIWTIGTPDRSAHEFLNGTATAANTGVVTGGDLRQYYGNYDYWAEEQTLGNPGKIVYYATAVGSTPATNDPQKWIGNQWQKFNPGLYDASNNTTDNYSKLCPAYVTAGGGPGNYIGAPWQVNFACSSAQLAQGQYVVLSVGLAATEADLTITLNGHQEVWTRTNVSGPMYRSGVAGTYQMLVFQWPVADLNAAGVQDQLTFSVDTTDGVMYDALRMEITNTSANPNTTGFHDYEYINGAPTQTGADSYLPTDPSTWNLSTGGSWSTSGNWLFGVPNAAGATAFFASGPGVSSPGTVNLSANQTVGTLVFNNTVGGGGNSYTIAQGGGLFALTLDNGLGQALVVDEAGNQLIAAPVTLNSTAQFDVVAATNTLSISGEIGGTGALIKSGAGTLLLSGADTYSGSTAVNAGSLTISAGGSIASSSIVDSAGATLNVNGALTATAAVTANGNVNFAGNSSSTAATTRALGTLSVGAAGVVTVLSSPAWSAPVVLQPATLSITTGGKLDLTSNELITSESLTTLRGQIVAGQVTTSTAGTNGGVGSLDLGNGTCEARYALLGDTNLDGNVNVADLANLAGNFGVTTGATWIGGDFDYNGSVNVADLADLAGNFGANISNAAAVPASMARVPEPTALALLCSTVPSAIRRRRKWLPPRHKPNSRL